MRLLTNEIVYFMKPKKPVKNSKGEQYVPPGVRFIWGSFMFDGVIESINENLEFFSEDGKPLRASIALSIGSQDVQFQFSPPGDKPGTSPLHQAKKGEDMQKIASKNGIPDWKPVAMALGIENPRFIPPGTMFDLNKANKKRLKK
ncbi:Uncharacterised protein [uncultured archaeon]|nr:Uncharacterised protein [uncultured archaeon]